MDSKEISRSMNQVYHAFLRVNELNYQIQRAKHTLRLKTERLTEASAVLAERQASYDKFALVAQELERETEFVAENLRRRREQLNAAKSSREYDSLKLQIEMDEAKSDRLTDETISALSNLEESEVALADAKKAWQDRQTVWETATKEFKSIEAEGRRNIQKTLEDARILTADLPKDHANAIARNLKNGNEPIAPVVDDAYCGACNEGLPPDVVLKIKEGAALCCYSCGKLLFIPDGDVS